MLPRKLAARYLAMTPLDPNTEKLAVALGWMRCDRNGIEVWYDPEGGHVLPHELPDALKCALDELIANAGDPLPEDLAALAKLGDPFAKIRTPRQS